MRPGEIGDPPVTSCQVRQNLPARWIRQCGKSSVQCCGRILNHLVNYVAAVFKDAKHFFSQFAKAVGLARRVFQIAIYDLCALHFDVEPLAAASAATITSTDPIA